MCDFLMNDVHYLGSNQTIGDFRMYEVHYLQFHQNMGDFRMYYFTIYDLIKPLVTFECMVCSSKHG